ncbi:MAG: hypothetical protein RL435_556, partial [Actinomycetota bacterium]
TLLILLCRRRVVAGNSEAKEMGRQSGLAIAERLLDHLQAHLSERRARLQEKG